jgi:hypothetical protein
MHLRNFQIYFWTNICELLTERPNILSFLDGCSQYDDKFLDKFKSYIHSCVTIFWGLWLSFLIQSCFGLHIHQWFTSQTNEQVDHQECSWRTCIVKTSSSPSLDFIAKTSCFSCFLSIDILEAIVLQISNRHHRNINTIN